MSEPADPQPPERQRAPLPRIGDAERDRAVDALQTHLAEGRLDREEFDDRLGRPSAPAPPPTSSRCSTTCPSRAPRPGWRRTASYTPPPWTSRRRPPPPPSPAVVPGPGLPATRPRPLGATLALTLIWPLDRALYFALGWDHWWVFIVAAVVSTAVRKTWPGEQRPRRRRPRARPARRTDS